MSVQFVNSAFNSNYCSQTRSSEKLEYTELHGFEFSLLVITEPVVLGECMNEINSLKGER
jgi:hypothetical protein